MEEKLTPSREDYLEAIYDLSLREYGEKPEGREHVRSVDVAARLGVSRASVNKALGLLKESGLAEQQPYGAIYLTEKGKTAAARVRRCHTTVRSFLEDVLGVDAEVAEVEACRMEHAISDRTLDSLAEFLERIQQSNSKNQ